MSLGIQIDQQDPMPHFRQAICVGRGQRRFPGTALEVEEQLLSPSNRLWYPRQLRAQSPQILGREALVFARRDRRPRYAWDLGKLLGAVSRGFHRSLLRTSKPQRTCCPCAPLDLALPEAGNFAQPPLAELGSLTRAPGRSALESSSEFLKSSFRIGTPDQGLERRPELRLANVPVTKAALCSVSHAVLRSWLQQPSVFRMAEAAREARPDGEPRGAAVPGPARPNWINRAPGYAIGFEPPPGALSSRYPARLPARASVPDPHGWPRAPAPRGDAPRSPGRRSSFLLGPGQSFP